MQIYDALPRFAREGVGVLGRAGASPARGLGIVCAPIVRVGLGPRTFPRAWFRASGRQPRPRPKGCLCAHRTTLGRARLPRVKHSRPVLGGMDKGQNASTASVAKDVAGPGGLPPRPHPCYYITTEDFSKCTKSIFFYGNACDQKFLAA